MKSKFFGFSFLFLLFFFVYTWGYFTHSRKWFPYTLLHAPKEIKTEDYQLDELKKINPDSLFSPLLKNPDSLRLDLIEAIFYNNQLPHSSLDNFKQEKTKYKIQFADNEAVCSLLVDGYFISNIYKFEPKQSNQKYMIYHHGHEVGTDKESYIIDRFLQEGYTVFTLSMPLILPNGIDTIQNEHRAIRDRISLFAGSNNHQKMMYLKKPLLPFIQPVIQTINYIFEKDPKAVVSMSGLSGGGWTTTICAAIDPRISKSFPVAGSYPMYIRYISDASASWGDFEQHYEPIFSKIDYLDLYVLACSQARSQYQILNLHDACCFKGGLSYLYAESVNKKNKSLQFGPFYHWVDSIETNHCVSNKALDYIIKNNK
jgi:hypothetical protein